MSNVETFPWCWFVTSLRTNPAACTMYADMYTVVQYCHVVGLGLVQSIVYIWVYSKCTLCTLVVMTLQFWDTVDWY